MKREREERIIITAGCTKYNWLLLMIFAIQIAYPKKIQQHPINRDYMYDKSNFYFSLFPAVSPKPKISSFDNPYQMSVRLNGRMNFNVGMVYMYNFNKSFGIATGIYSALLSFKTLKYNYTIPDDIMAHLNLYQDYCFKCTGFINHSTTFPIRFIYRKEVATKIDITTSAGMNLQLQRSFYYEFNDVRGIIGQDTSSFRTFTITLENSGSKKFKVVPYIDISIGINQLLKNNHYINYQFSADIPLYNPYKNGNFYLLPGTAYEEHGTYQLNPLSFGFEVNYVFTFNRRKIRKEQQKSYFKNYKKIIE